MKSYPSIQRFRDDRYLNFQGETFAKLDGSNLRFEWDQKKGWHRFGSRRRMLETTHSTFGVSMNMFQELYAETFQMLAADKKWSSIIVFCEFYGRNSFAGEHDEADEKSLTLIDVAIHKRGLMAPSDFVRHFDGQFDLHCLGVQTWDAEFVKAVQQSRWPGMAFEGVVGKNGSGHKRRAIKLKSEAWIKKVMTRYGTEKGTKIVNS